jgi:heptosyltransferase-2
MAKPQLDDFKHIAIIQTAFLGDVVLAMPLVRVIKKNYPDIKISFVSTPLAAGITSSVKDIDSVISYDKRGIRKGLDGIKHIAGYLRENGVDCIISSHRSLRTSLLTFFTKAKYSVGFNTSAFSFAYKKRIKYIKSAHEIERNLALLKAFADYDSLDLDWRDIQTDISDNDKTYVESQLAAVSQEYDKIIALAPGSIWETKKWKEKHFVRLAIMLKDAGYMPILIGSESDAPLCETIAGESAGMSFGGKFTLPQTIYFLSLANVLVTNDSAPTHFAGLVNCPVITLFGPTSPVFGFAPWSSKSISLGIDNLKCRPCEIHGGNKCPVGTHECMEKLLPETVFDAVMSLLS